MSTRLATTDVLDVFIKGFSTTRSYVRPYVPRQLSRTLWVLADTVPSGRERTPEVIGYGASPEEVLEARAGAGLTRHTLCVLLDDPSEAPEAIPAYKAVGYRLMTREPLFVLDTSKRVRHDAAPVRRITSAEMAAAVTSASGARQIFPQHLVPGDSECRLYAAYDGETPIGWTRSIRTHPDRAWVAGLYVQAAHRRQGIGRTLMSAMLDDDERFGVRWSVLLASFTGALLYPHLGYEQKGLLLVFTPRKSDTP